MATSAARIEANRRNALKSTGPRTEAGKAASRANALWHGRTGTGVVLPGEDRDEVEQRFEALARELAPGGDAASLILARQVAMLSVRSERAFRHDTAATAERARLAVAELDDARRAEVVHLLDQIADDPAAVAAQLRATAEGCDLLLDELQTLRAAAVGRSAGGWDLARADRLACLAGRRLLVDPTRGDQVAAIDAEVARVEAAIAAIDPAEADADRAEAAARALVDTTPEGDRARRYEAATDRALFRALRELRALRRDRDHADLPPFAPLPPTPPPPPRPAPAEPILPPAPAPSRPIPAPALGSFCPPIAPAPVAAEFLPIAASRTAPKPAEPARDRRRRPKLPWRLTDASRPLDTSAEARASSRVGTPTGGGEANRGSPEPVESHLK